MMEANGCLCWLDWTQDETEVQGDNTHLWEESWDDDDTSEDFSAQLKYIFWSGPLRDVFCTDGMFLERS
jgi:hypothetical protein